MAFWILRDRCFSFNSSGMSICRRSAGQNISSVFEYMVDRCQYHACNGDDGSFLATATRDIFILDVVVVLAGAFHGGMSHLHKHRLDVDSCTGNSNRLLLAGRLIVAGEQADPTAKPLRRTELRHIHGDFRKNRFIIFFSHCCLFANNPASLSFVMLPLMR